MKRETCGFHSFRRFRVAHLEQLRVPEILIRIWIGHSIEDLTKKYGETGIKQSVEFRREEAEQAGLGFVVPNLKAELHHVAPTLDQQVHAVSA
jgi:hypothetical protein